MEVSIPVNISNSFGPKLRIIFFRCQINAELRIGDAFMERNVAVSLNVALHMVSNDKHSSYYE
jgi:hypothetical protein